MRSWCHSSMMGAAGSADAIFAEDSYPLDRFLLIYVRTPISPLAREFVKLMLSREGQEAVAASPQRYIPLSAREAAAERARLDQQP